MENERVLLEIAALGDAPGQSTMNIRCSDRNELTTSRVDLAPGEVKQIVLDLPPGSPALSASVGADALEIDNQAVLLPEAAKPCERPFRSATKSCDARSATHWKRPATCCSSASGPS